MKACIDSGNDNKIAEVFSDAFNDVYFDCYKNSDKYIKCFERLRALIINPMYIIPLNVKDRDETQRDRPIRYRMDPPETKRPLCTTGKQQSTAARGCDAKVNRSR